MKRNAILTLGTGALLSLGLLGGATTMASADTSAAEAQAFLAAPGSLSAYSVEKLCHAKIGPRIWNIALITDPLANHVSGKASSRESILLTLPVGTRWRVFQRNPPIVRLYLSLIEVGAETAVRDNRRFYPEFNFQLLTKPCTAV